MTFAYLFCRCGILFFRCAYLPKSEKFRVKWHDRFPVTKYILITNISHYFAFLQQLHRSSLYSLFILIIYTLFIFIYFYSYFHKVNIFDTNIVVLKCLVRTILVHKSVWYKLGHRNILARLWISLFERVKFDRAKSEETKRYRILKIYEKYKCDYIYIYYTVHTQIMTNMV